MTRTRETRMIGMGSGSGRLRGLALQNTRERKSKGNIWACTFTVEAAAYVRAALRTVLYQGMVKTIIPCSFK